MTERAYRAMASQITDVLVCLGQALLDKALVVQGAAESKSHVIY